jgi:mRNA interferase RelE/StbE
MYRLKFLPSALREWKKLAEPVKEQLRKKLKERLETPRVPANRLYGFKDVYKIKLRASGYRLVYEVDDMEITVMVIAVGKREKGKVYSKTVMRLSDS